MFLPLMAQLRVGRDVGRPHPPGRGPWRQGVLVPRDPRPSSPRGIRAVIPEPDDQKGHRKRRGSRGGRPVGLDAADYKQPQRHRAPYCHIKQWRGLATRYDKHAVVYRAAVVLNAVIAWTRQLSDTP
jgi:hypothetical protein